MIRRFDRLLSRRVDARVAARRSTAWGALWAYLSYALVVAALIVMSLSTARAENAAKHLGEGPCSALASVAALATPQPPDHFLRRVEELAAWTVANSRYQEIRRLPTFIFLPRELINYIVYNGTDAGYTGQSWVRAIYLDNLVVLPDDFVLGRDDYIVVHELVHHLQHEAGAMFECLGAREREAYEIQIKFVDETGTGEKPNPLWFALALRCHHEGF